MLTVARLSTTPIRGFALHHPSEVELGPHGGRQDRPAGENEPQGREVAWVPALLVEGRVGVYVCGLTVQSEPHVGHVRSAVNFDVLRRWLAHRGFAVDFIRNVTDIDDKILTKAEVQGRPWYNLAYDMKRELDRAYAALNVLPPTYEPAATGHVPSPSPSSSSGNA